MKISVFNFAANLFAKDQRFTVKIKKKFNLHALKSTFYFAGDLYSVIYGLVVLQRRRTDIRLPRLAVYDINHMLNPINFG